MKMVLGGNVKLEGKIGDLLGEWRKIDLLGEWRKIKRGRAFGRRGGKEKERERELPQGELQ